MDAQTQKMVASITKNAEIIAKALKKGDVELRKSANGVSIAEIKKTVIAR